MIEVFHESHLAELRLQPTQEAMKPLIEQDGYAEFLRLGHAYSVRHNGRIVMCFGFIPLWIWRWQAWALFSGDIGHAGMVRAHYAARRALDLHRFQRLEAYVQSSFEAGHRWIKLLGFEYEGEMRKFDAQGLDYALYARCE